MKHDPNLAMTSPQHIPCPSHTVYMYYTLLLTPDRWKAAQHVGWSSCSWCLGQRCLDLRRLTAPQTWISPLPLDWVFSSLIPYWSRPSSPRGQAAHITRSARRPDSTGSCACTCGARRAPMPVLEDQEKEGKEEEASGHQWSGPVQGPHVAWGSHFAKRQFGVSSSNKLSISLWKHVEV